MWRRRRRHQAITGGQADVAEFDVPVAAGQTPREAVADFLDSGDFSNLVLAMWSGAPTGWQRVRVAGVPGSVRKITIAAAEWARRSGDGPGPG